MSAHKLLIFGKGFQYSRDGIGNRLVFHLQGCDLRCPWCANPEGMSREPVLLQKTSVIPEWVCKDFDRSKCRSCADRTCLKPNDSLVLSSREYTVEELCRESVSANPMMYDGGGVTLTGGEVCTQAESAAALLAMLRESGINTMIETNLSSVKLPLILPHLDAVIADYKHYDADILSRVAGGRLGIIEDNIRMILERGIPLSLRIPLIHGFNDLPDAPEKFAAALSGLARNGKFTVELLPYHEYGKDKWRECGLEYKVTDGFVTDDFVRKMETALKKSGIELRKT